MHPVTGMGDTGIGDFGLFSTGYIMLFKNTPILDFFQAIFCSRKCSKYFGQHDVIIWERETKKFNFTYIYGYNF